MFLFCFGVDIRMGSFGDVDDCCIGVLGLCYRNFSYYD